MRKASLGWALVVGLSSLGLVRCAGRLLGDSELTAAPVEFKQEIQTASVPVTDAQTTAPAKTEGVLRETPVMPVPGAPAPVIAKVIEKKEKPAKAQKKSKKSKNASTAKSEAQQIVNAAPVRTWQPRVWPFGIGEKFELALRYGPIEGGIVSFEVMEPQILNGETVLHYSARVRSSKILELFYKVDDQMQSWVGIRDHLPRRQEIKQIESATWGRRVVLFDQGTGTAKFFSSATKKNGQYAEVKREDPMTPFAQDVFGSLYFYRFIDSLDKVAFPIHDRWQNWRNELTFLGKERVHVPMGDMDTLHFKMRPLVQGNLEPKGDVEMWISDDDRRLIVQFRAAIKVGSITGELKSYEPGRKPAMDPPLMRTPIDF